MRLRFTPRALANLADLANYLNERNPDAAERVRAAIDASVQLLVEFPYTGRLLHSAGVRRLVTRRYPFLVYYLVDEDAGEVVILNVKHPARQRDYDEP